MATHTCPVCKMTVDDATAPSLVHEGTTYYFCSDACRRAFQKRPERFAPAGPAR